tara:strand:+ start:418 stop:597 length:180 start_codon:yes stop_codon:yes gene_type:complete
MNINKETFNITIKCETEEERDFLLELVCDSKIAKCYPVSNVFFSENNEYWRSEKQREVN